METRIGIFIVLIHSYGKAQAADQAVIESFYGGLAGVIEQHTNDPDTCVKEVEKYFKTHTESVAKIKSFAMDGMQQIDDYRNMTEQEALALEGKSTHKDIPEIPEGLSRYSIAMQKFGTQNPEQGMYVANIIMKYLMPDTWHISEQAIQ